MLHVSLISNETVRDRCAAIQMRTQHGNEQIQIQNLQSLILTTIMEFPA